jgi:hypothetical protein
MEFNDPTYELRLAGQRLAQTRSEVSRLRLSGQSALRGFALLDAAVIRASRGAQRRQAQRSGADSGAAGVSEPAPTGALCHLRA